MLQIFIKICIFSLREKKHKLQSEKVSMSTENIEPLRSHLKTSEIARKESDDEVNKLQSLW